jgi:predicted transcriptional regulator of viral defense system
VITELALEGLLDLTVLREVARRYPASAVRRVGWILERFSSLDLGGGLGSGSVAPTQLDPDGGRRGPIDRRWQIIVNTVVQPDL